MSVTKEQLENYDFIVLIDKSGSMSSTTANGQTRWEAAKESAIAIAQKVAQYDKDGITIIPFANTFKVYANTTVDLVEQIFRENEPLGGTDTAGVLKHVFDEYFKNPAKPIMVFVITDGEPNAPKEAVAKVIIEATKKMENDEQIGVQFFQVGNDPAAKAFLQSLDDDLQAQGAKFDIVDTVTAEDAENRTLTELILGAFND
jgi:uncharacterized protein with von Willebrand factor type A (vWA) domain